MGCGHDYFVWLCFNIEVVSVQLATILNIMYNNWQEYINDFKHLSTPNPLRLHLTEDELQLFWESQSLSTFESIMTLTTPTLTNFLYGSLLPHYLSLKRITQQAYSVSTLDDKGNQQNLMYVYDCKFLKGNIYTKQQNDFLSSFMLIYRENVVVNERIFQVVSPNRIPCDQWVIKVKESGLLRVHTYLKEAIRRIRHRNDKVILEVGEYDIFSQEWLKCYCGYNLQVATGYFFRAVLVLLQNQVMLAYLNTLSPQAIYQKTYQKAIKIIDKPRNVEQFTLTEGVAETETQWQTLKITAFKLKYRIQEQQNKYLCFLMADPQQAIFRVQDFNEEDIKMLQGFQLARGQVPYSSYQ